MGNNEQLTWRQSSKCQSSTCLQVARDGDEYLIRNSEQPDDVLRFTKAEWDAFIAGANADEFRFGE